MFKRNRLQAQVQYELVRLLGMGGGGEVYSAWRFADDLSPKQKVALKIVKASFDGESLAQLRNEARVLSGINTPHVVQIFGIEKLADGSFALAMELVEGCNLAEWFRRIAVEQRRDLFWKLGLHLLKGLTELHSRNIIHGDLSPKNVLISSKGIAKIVDFGLSSLRSKGEAVELRGTPGYLSAKRLRGEQPSMQDDYFAAGCLLFECLFGEKLFSNPKSLKPDQITELIESKLILARPKDGDVVEVSLIKKLLLITNKDHDGQVPFLNEFAKCFDSFPYLPFFNSENTETLPLQTRAIWVDSGHARLFRWRGYSFRTKKLISFTVTFFMVCGISSATKTSVVVPLAASGSAIINAKPWAHVYLDGQDLGETPVSIPKLRAGFHRVDFVGGEQEKTIWFEVYPKSTARITHRFERI